MKYYIFCDYLNKYIMVDPDEFYDYIRALKCEYISYSFNTVYFSVPDKDIPFCKTIKAFCIDVNKPFCEKEKN